MIEQPHVVRFVGGGPDNGVDPRYLEQLAQLGDLINGGEERILAWWQRSPVPELELWFWMDREKLAYRTRKARTKMTAQIERSARSTREAVDPGAMATMDVHALLVKVAERLELGPPPDLRGDVGGSGGADPCRSFG